MPRRKKTDLLPWQAQALEKAQRRSAKRPSSSDSTIISIKGGVFSFQGAPLSETLNVVILDECPEYSYYATPYSEGEFQTPTCYSIGTPLSALVESTEMLEGLVPDKKSPVPQNKDCASCEHNQFFSAKFGTGKGKACGNRRRLLVMAADQLDDIENSMVGVIKVPPTGINKWDAYADWLYRIKKATPEYCITRISLQKLRPTDMAALPHYEFMSFLPDDVAFNIDGVIERSQHILTQPFLAPTRSITLPDIRGAVKKRTVKKRTVKK
jgi:hypothetical protein